VLGEPDGEGDRRAHIVHFQTGIMIDDFFRRESPGQGIEDDADMDSRAADMGPAAANFSVHGDPREQTLFVSHWTGEKPTSSNGTQDTTPGPSAPAKI